MTEARKHHWLENDFRYSSLELLFKKYEEILDHYKENCFHDLYWDETYLIYGIILVSLQNYINQNCTDFMDSNMLSKDKKSSYYKIHSKEIANGTTQIQLIIHLANYFKHRDDNTTLHKHTLECLKNVELIDESLSKETELENRKEMRFDDDIVVEGISKISSLEYPMQNLLDVVEKWREGIWKQFYDEEAESESK